jgi:hypothetical protein
MGKGVASTGPVVEYRLRNDGAARRRHPLRPGNITLPVNRKGLFVIMSFNLAPEAEGNVMPSHLRSRG